ncbi:MAG: hypothetical protein PHF63_00250 [Herbinix sp.]|nr:hypothetical protein [Herbinix sp.]
MDTKFIESVLKNIPLLGDEDYNRKARLRNLVCADLKISDSTFYRKLNTYLESVDCQITEDLYIKKVDPPVVEEPVAEVLNPSTCNHVDADNNGYCDICASKIYHEDSKGTNVNVPDGDLVIPPEATPEEPKLNIFQMILKWLGLL